MIRSRFCILITCLLSLSSCGKKSKSDDVNSPIATDSLGLTKNDVPSFYGVKIRDAIAQAEKEDKIVWLEISGAWCEPCNIFEALERDYKDEFAPAIQSTVRVHVEQMYNPRLIASDVVNIGFVRYPTQLLYSPKFKSWSQVTAPARYFKRVIPFFKQYGNVSDLLTSDMQERMEKPEAFTNFTQSDDSSYQYGIVKSLLFEGKAKLAAEFVQKMKAYDAKYGLKTISNSLDTFAPDFVSALDRGKLTEEDLIDNFPGFNDLKANNIELKSELNFRIVITNLAKSSGTQAAADACLQKYHEVYDVAPKARALAATASEAERATAKISDDADLAAFNRLGSESGIECETLRIENKLPASDLLKNLETLVNNVKVNMSSKDLSFRDASKFSRLAILKARLGDFTTAKELVAQALDFADAQSKVATSKAEYEGKVKDAEEKLATMTDELEKVKLRNQITEYKYVAAAKSHLETNTKDTLKRLLGALESGQVLPN